MNKYKDLEDLWTEGYWKLICDNEDKVAWYNIAINPNITWEKIVANPNKPWNRDWGCVSENPNITWEIIVAK